MKYYKSKDGRIKSEREWESLLFGFWSDLHGNDVETKAKWPQPVDAWERFVRLQGLEEYTSKSCEYKGVF